jgi:hypothetical protein
LIGAIFLPLAELMPKQKRAAMRVFVIYRIVLCC